MRVILTSEASKDLLEIGHYIKRDNPDRARSFVQELVDRCEDLARMARMSQSFVSSLARELEREPTRTISSSIG